MFSIETIRLGLYNWVTTVTETNAIWLNPNAPRIELPYITLEIGNITTHGWDYEIPPDTLGKSALAGDRELILEVNYYGNNGSDALELLKSSLGSHETIEQLGRSGLHYVNRLAEVSTTELLDVRWEQRRMIEFRFRTSSQGIDDANTQDVGCIESVPIEGDYTNKK